MSTLSQLSDTLHRVLEQPTGGIVGLVDDLFRLCSEERVQLDWEGDCCRVRSLANGAEELAVRPLAKPVFRAVLARVAALCNEQLPNSVSPYGGQGELVLRTEPVSSVRVSFANTLESQSLRVIPVHGFGG